MKLPKYVGNLPAWVVYNTKITAAVRDTYAQIRGLGNSDKSLKVKLVEIINATGKSRSTLYEHLRILNKLGSLEHSIVEDTLFVEFFDDQRSRSSDGLLSSLTKDNKVNVTSLRIKRPSESSDLERTPEREAMELAYVREMIKYHPGTLKEEDDEALDWLSQHYTVDQVSTVYWLHKADKFWSNKQIRPKHLRTMVPEHYNRENRNNGSDTTTYSDDPIEQALLAKRRATL